MHEEQDHNMSDCGSRATKRVKVGRKLLGEYPPKEYLELFKELLSGSEVIVIVEGGKEFKVAKNLLCYNSGFFEEALDSDKSGETETEQRVELENATVGGFELVLQWMHRSQIVLPEKEAKEESKIKSLGTGSASPEYHVIDDEDETGAWKITNYLNFLKLAQEIKLLGPYDSVYQGLIGVLVSSRMSLNIEHLRVAAELPKGHIIRKLFAQTCVMPYIYDSNQDRYTAGRIEFIWHQALDELESFSSDLFKEYGQTIRQKEIHRKPGKQSYFTFKDPLTGQDFTV